MIEVSNIRLPLDAGLPDGEKLVRSAVANVLGVYTYELGLKNMKYSESTAVSLFLTVINFALVMITNAVSKRVNDYGIW